MGYKNYSGKEIIIRASLILKTTNDIGFSSYFLKGTSSIIIILLIFLILISPYVYKIWVGNSFHISFSLSMSIILYLITTIILSPFSAFINGFGRHRLSLYSTKTKICLYIPLILVLAEKFGAVGVVLSIPVVNLGSLILEPLQVFKLINQKAYGIWNK